MSMSNYANCADVVEDNFVKQHAPEEYEDLCNLLEINDVYMSELAFCKIFQEEFPSGIEEECEKKYNALLNKFKSNTGLDLYINFHEAEEKGDEVDGYFWCVDGVYQYTEAGKKYEMSITKRMWTTWG